MENREFEKLPKEVQNKLKAYLKRIKKVDWFKPKKIDKKEIEKKVKFILQCFGVKASVEYRKLETKKDWDVAWNAAWNAARNVVWDAAWNAAWNAARNTARNAVRNVAWDAARNVARNVVWGATEIVAMDLKSFKTKYPNGAFIHLIDLWEMGLYPIGIINKKFVIYLPKIKK